ncbi:MAG: LPS assembly protein LptD, partial [Thermodesulfobacteriota bacterium]|nr:LPS assembly protein LptD [Thermodesulfobacteriota bacterium]
EDSEGVFLFDILSDREDKDMDDPDEVELSPFDRTNSTRYWLRARADQDLPFGLMARLDVDYVSDQDYLNEFEDGLFGFEARSDLAKESGRPVEEERSPLRRTALRVGRNAEAYTIQAMASYHQLPENPSEDPTAEPLAGLNFILLPDRVADLFPIYLGLESDYDYVWRDAGQKGHRFSLSPELRFPLWLGPYIEFEPSISCTYNAHRLEDPGENPERQSKRAFEVGARLSATAERIFDLGWRDVRKVKHKMSPVLSYKYRDHRDEKAFRPWFDPIDEVEDINQIALSLEHYLDARLENEKGEATYHQWATLNLSQGYDIDEARRHGGTEGKKEPFLPLSATLMVTPFPDLDLRGHMQWDHYDHVIPEASLSLELFVKRSGGRRDIYTVDYLYSRKDDQKSLDFWFNVNLAYGFSLGSSLERDLEAGQNISNRYWLEYASQCWGIQLGAEEEDEETSIQIVFRFLGLGDIRAW